MVFGLPNVWGCIDQVQQQSFFQQQATDPPDARYARRQYTLPFREPRESPPLIRQPRRPPLVLALKSGHSILSSRSPIMTAVPLSNFRCTIRIDFILVLLHYGSWAILGRNYWCSSESKLAFLNKPTWVGFVGLSLPYRYLARHMLNLQPMIRDLVSSGHPWNLRSRRAFQWSSGCDSKLHPKPSV